jgi:hypothetical protein
MVNDAFLNNTRSSTTNIAIEIVFNEFLIGLKVI